VKLKIKKDQLVAVLDKMYEVSTKSIKAEYDMADRVTVDIEPKQVIFLSSNGNLDAKSKLTEQDDASILDNEPGSFTVTTSKFREMVKNLPTDSMSTVLSIDEDGDMLRVADPSRKRRLVKLQKDSRPHKLNFSKPKNKVHNFEKALFSRAISKVSPFMTTMGYKIKYLMTCIHFLPDETRFICGNGSIFAIFRFKDIAQDITDQTGIKYIIPTKQSLLINNLLSDCDKVSISWESATQCHIDLNNGTELVLKGIPSLDYIAYDNHAFRMNDAKAIVDIPIKEFKAAVQSIESCKDKERDKGGFSCDFQATRDADGITHLSINEGNYQCDCSTNGDYYNLGDKPSFVSSYTSDCLLKVAGASEHEYVRLYCIEEGGIMVAETVNLLSQKNDKGVPEIKDEEDTTKLSFFFCAHKNDSESS
jgi:DNA polymerase III sliding clamp (beta) subunit (PCNA family)